MEPSKAYLSFPKTKTLMTADLALVGIIQGGEKKTQQLSGNFSENAPKLSSASGAGDQFLYNP